MENVGGQTNKQIVQVALIVAIFAGFYFGLTRVDAYIRERAIDNCARISEYKEKLNNGTTEVKYPIKDVYTQCLSDKNITTQ